MEFVNTVYFVDASSTQVLAKRFRASRLSGETTTISTTGRLRLCEAVLRSCCDPCLFTGKLLLRNTQRHFEDKIQSQIM